MYTYYVCTYVHSYCTKTNLLLDTMYYQINSSMYIRKLMYVMYIHYVDRPRIKITTATGGCRYVYVSWIVIGNLEENVADIPCSIGQFRITLSSMNTTKTLVNSAISHNFTGLPDDTLFNFTIIGLDAEESAIINRNSTSVRTALALKGTYIILSYLHYVQYFQ